jgi:hypothetical protein
MPSPSPHRIVSMGRGFVEDRWDEISGLLDTAFGFLTLPEGPTAERPDPRTWEKMRRPGVRDLRHVVAVGGDGDLLGAVFCVPTARPRNATHCELEWFFTHRGLPESERARIADAMVRTVDEELENSGYETVVTGIGTEADEQYLSRRHGYMPAPLAERKNRWIKSLRTASGGGGNSVRKKWKNAEGQYARYASMDIGEGDVIIDLKTVLKRVADASAQTLQLGEGYYYQGSEQGLGVNHHCSSNGYICFDDLTYRALSDVSMGDELTFHYCTTEFEMDTPFDCCCGSPKCLGRLGGLKYLNESEVEEIFDLLSPFLRTRLHELDHAERSGAPQSPPVQRDAMNRTQNRGTLVVPGAQT